MHNFDDLKEKFDENLNDIKNHSKLTNQAIKINADKIKNLQQVSLLTHAIIQKNNIEIKENISKIREHKVKNSNKNFLNNYEKLVMDFHIKLSKISEHYNNSIDSFAGCNICSAFIELEQFNFMTSKTLLFFSHILIYQFAYNWKNEPIFVNNLIKENKYLLPLLFAIIILARHKTSELVKFDDLSDLTMKSKYKLSHKLWNEILQDNHFKNILENNILLLCVEYKLAYDNNVDDFINKIIKVQCGFYRSIKSINIYLKAKQNANNLWQSLNIKNKEFQLATNLLKQLSIEKAILTKNNPWTIGLFSEAIFEQLCDKNFNIYEDKLQYKSDFVLRLNISDIHKKSLLSIANLIIPKGIKVLSYGIKNTIVNNHESNITIFWQDLEQDISGFPLPYLAVKYMVNENNIINQCFACLDANLNNAKLLAFIMNGHNGKISLLNDDKRIKTYDNEDILYFIIPKHHSIKNIQIANKFISVNGHGNETTIKTSTTKDISSFSPFRIFENTNDDLINISYIPCSIKKNMIDFLYHKEDKSLIINEEFYLNIPEKILYITKNEIKFKIIPFHMNFFASSYFMDEQSIPNQILKRFEVSFFDDNVILISLLNSENQILATNIKQHIFAECENNTIVAIFIAIILFINGNYACEFNEEYSKNFNTDIQKSIIFAYIFFIAISRNVTLYINNNHIDSKINDILLFLGNFFWTYNNDKTLDDLYEECLLCLNKEIIKNFCFEVLKMYSINNEIFSIQKNDLLSLFIPNYIKQIGIFSSFDETEKYLSPLFTSYNYIFSVSTMANIFNLIHHNGWNTLLPQQKECFILLMKNEKLKEDLLSFSFANKNQQNFNLTNNKKSFINKLQFWKL